MIWLAFAAFFATGLAAGIAVTAGVMSDTWDIDEDWERFFHDGISR